MQVANVARATELLGIGTLHRVTKRLSITALICSTLLTVSCGYHTTTHYLRLPDSVHAIAVPAFTNQTQNYRMEQVLTAAVVREFVTRTKFRILNEPTDDADATLRGTVVSTQLAPLTYDSQTGRASSALVTVTMRVSLVDRKGASLFDNPNYTFREQYQVSRELTSFFEEDAPAIDRLSRDFARTLVSNILEAY